MCHNETLNLKQVAQRLDVHYMTVYRYVRTGRLPARQDGNVWLVDGADLAAFAGIADHDELEAGVDWAARLCERFVEGDDPGAWATVEAALAAGRNPDAMISLIGDAVRRSGEDEAHVSGAYLAVGTAERTLAILASRFRPRGRRRGTVLLGAPGSEGHGLALSLLAVTLRLRNLGVLELGTGVPTAAFLDAGRRANGLIAIGLGVTTVERLDETSDIVNAVHSALPGVPVVLGGQAVRSLEVAQVLGADEWAPDIEGMVDRLEEVAPRSRRKSSDSKARPFIPVDH